MQVTGETGTVEKECISAARHRGRHDPGGQPQPGSSTSAEWRLMALADARIVNRGKTSDLRN